MARDMSGGPNRESDERVRRAAFVLGAILVASCGGASAPTPLKPTTPTASRSLQAASSAAPAAGFGAGPGASTASAGLTPKLHELSTKPTPTASEPREIVGKHVASSLFESLRTFGSDSDTDMYDRLFPKRLSWAACRK